jgi:hypothetical protein
MFIISTNILKNYFDQKFHTSSDPAPVDKAPSIVNFRLGSCFELPCLSSPVLTWNQTFNSLLLAGHAQLLTRVHGYSDM